MVLCSTTTAFYAIVRADACRARNVGTTGSSYPNLKNLFLSVFVVQQCQELPVL
jgi:hypothetical protein